MTKEEILNTNPLLLAYLGDAVFEVLVRKHLVLQPGVNPAECNRSALMYVTAKSQREAVKKLIGLFNEEEAALFKRAKNSKAGTVPSNCDIYTYRLATGLEAVFGFNSLCGNDDRNKELFDIAFNM